MTNEDTPRCTATSSRTGARCKKRPIDGGTVCATHGGSAPQVRAAADRRVQIRKLEKDINAALVADGVAPVDDPFGELALLAGEARDFKNALASRLSMLDSIRYKATESGTEQLRSEVVLYERALDRTARFVELLAKSGFEERRVRLAESEGRVLAGVIQRILADLKLSPEQAELVHVVVPRELRAIAAGSHPPTEGEAA